jgi:hypothetical protein
MATRVLMRARLSPIGYMLLMLVLLVLLALQSSRFRAALVRVALGMVGNDTLRPTRPSLHR